MKARSEQFGAGRSAAAGGEAGAAEGGEAGAAAGRRRRAAAPELRDRQQCSAELRSCDPSSRSTISISNGSESLRLGSLRARHLGEEQRHAELLGGGLQAGCNVHVGGEVRSVHLRAMFDSERCASAALPHKLLGLCAALSTAWGV